MTPTATLKLLAQVSALIQIEQLAIVTVYAYGDHVSIELAPADFALFVRRHRLARRMHSHQFGKNTSCSVHFRGMRIITMVVTPLQSPGSTVEFPALETTPALARP